MSKIWLYTYHFLNNYTGIFDFWRVFLTEMATSRAESSQAEHEQLESLIVLVA